MYNFVLTTVMFTEFTRKRINEYVPDVYWVPIDINIVRFQIGCICTLTSFLRDHLGYRGCLKLKFRITLNQPNVFSAKIFVHTRTTTRFHEDTKTARSFVFDLSFYKRRATRFTSTVFSTQSKNSIYPPSSRAIFRYTSLNFTMDKKEKKKYYAADRKRIELNFDRKFDLTRERGKTLKRNLPSTYLRNADYPSRRLSR